MKWLSLEAVASVAYKEFLHIYRDRRVLLLVLTLPPLFTLLFGHAFETGELTGVPSLMIDRDNTPRAQEFIEIISKNKTFQWRMGTPDTRNESDLLGHGVQAVLVIPAGWNESLENGDPKPLLLYLDGSDINTADAVQGSVRQSLGDFQLKERDRIIDYVVPGIIGLILQLLTVTLMACTIARERESGTLYQLMITALRRREIVIGKMLPYLVVSSLLIVIIMLLSGWHFGVAFHDLPALALVCLLFLLCSLGLGLLISAFSRTQTQAIQFSVFFLLPVFVLSGAFAPLEQLPQAVRYISELFPLTHFCRAFRLVNMYGAGLHFYVGDLVILLAGAVITFLGAAFLLRRIEQ